MITSDRSWVGRSRYNELKYITKEYKSGVDSFLIFACDNIKDEDEGLMRCQCQKCKNRYFKDPRGVKVDLYLHEIMQRYPKWDLHEEKDILRAEVGMSSGIMIMTCMMLITR